MARGRPARRSSAGRSARPPGCARSPRRITLDIITRTVFGVADEARRERLIATLGAVLEWGGDPNRMAMLAVLGPKRVAGPGLFRRVLEPADALIYEEIRDRRDAPDLEEREDVLSLLLLARHEDGSSMSTRSCATS